MDRHQPSVVSRTADGPVVAPRAFGRRRARSAPTAVTPPPALYPEGVPEFSPVRWKRIAQKAGLIVLAFALLVYLQFSTFGLPGCDSYQAQDMLRQIARDVLGKAKVGFSRIAFTEIADVPTPAWGAYQCAATLHVDGRQGPRLVYEISWTFRLVVFNRYVVKILSASP